MPELPEVETVRKGLEAALLGKAIISARVFRHDLRVLVPENFSDVVAGRRIVDVTRRGKYIVCFLDSARVVILHLGMSGRIKIVEPDQAYNLQKHDHVLIKADDGTTILYHDPRRFGFIVVGDADRWNHAPPFNRMGPEPLSEAAFNAEILLHALAHRKGPIKTVLLDQGVVAGLGNIYVCEALYDAGISPERAACSLELGEAGRLVRSIRTILLRAIEAGGSTLKDYQKTDGSLGYFQYQFSVYGRAGERCGVCVCEEGSVVRTVQAGRSTFSCPVKQV